MAIVPLSTASQNAAVDLLRTISLRSSIKAYILKAKSELGDLKREIRELKEEIRSLKSHKGGLA